MPTPQSLTQASAIAEALIAHLSDPALPPWSKPWRMGAELPLNAVTGKPYRGANVLTLMLSSAGLPHGDWATLKQWNSLGYRVNAGARSTQLSFYTTYEASREHDDGSTTTSTRRCLKFFRVFHRSQTDAPPLVALELTPHIFAQRETEMLTWCQSRTIPIRPDPNRAFYSPAGDYIGMPQLS